MNRKWIVTAVLISAIFLTLVLSRYNLQASVSQSQPINIRKLPDTQPTKSVISVTKNIGKNITKDTSTNKLILVEKNIPQIVLTGQLSQHLQRLTTLHKAGDLEAGYVLAMNLKNCLAADSTVDELNNSINDLYKSHENRSNSAKFLVTDLQKINDTYHYCEGVSVQTRKIFRKYLYAVADQGYPPAQVMYGLVPSPILSAASFTDLPQEQQNLLVNEFKHKANRYLESAAHSGSITAMTFIVGNHRFGKDKNHVKALAYNLALLDLTEHSGIYDTFTDIRTKLEQQMSDKDIELAISRSTEIVESVNLNGILFSN
jgi:hypothetical protein